APSASPNAPNARPATVNANSHSGKRPHSSATNPPSTTTINRVTISPIPPASTIFSTSSPDRETGPRTRREKAFSVRSRASDPDARSTVTNISEIATASAAANLVSGTRETIKTCGEARERTRGAAQYLLVDLDRLTGRGEGAGAEVEVLLSERVEPDYLI